MPEQHHHARRPSFQQPTYVDLCSTLDVESCLQYANCVCEDELVMTGNRRGAMVMPGLETYCSKSPTTHTGILSCRFASSKGPHTKTMWPKIEVTAGRRAMSVKDRNGFVLCTIVLRERRPMGLAAIDGANSYTLPQSKEVYTHRPRSRASFDIFDMSPY